ncbi:MAG: hypothetical protein EHM70_09895 [Chloroflexota bacterium]|nr:MAG: hypothetical protein EHM70_09895 [Chloroflexota bacterium]
MEIEIIVEGRLDPRRSGWFEGLSLTNQPEGRTRITGSVPDQAALFALISRIRDLGLNLISVNRISSKPNLIL